MEAGGAGAPGIPFRSLGRRRGCARLGVLRPASGSRDGPGPGVLLRPPGPRAAPAPPAAPGIRGGSPPSPVELVCDVRRAPGCHGTSVARGTPATVVFAVEQGAQSAGWGKVRRRSNIISDDVCPACRAVGQPAATRRPPPRDAGPGTSGVLPTVVARRPTAAARRRSSLTAASASSRPPRPAPRAPGGPGRVLVRPRPVPPAPRGGRHRAGPLTVLVQLSRPDFWGGGHRDPDRHQITERFRLAACNYSAGQAGHQG